MFCQCVQFTYARFAYFADMFDSCYADIFGLHMLDLLICSVCWFCWIARFATMFGCCCWPGLCCYAQGTSIYMTGELRRGVEWNFCYGRSEHSWPHGAGDY